MRLPTMLYMRPAMAQLSSACAYAQSDQSISLSLEYSMSVELLTKHHLECLSLKRGCTGSSKPPLVKMPHCWKSHVAAHCLLLLTLSWSYLLFSPNFVT